MKKLLIIMILVASFCKNSSAQQSLLPPFPKDVKSLPINSVELGDWKSFPEQKLDIPIAAGPFEPTWESIEENYPGEPDWLRMAKFGIWVHFGPQSAGESGDWYARNLYKPGHWAYDNHIKRYGHPSEFGYKDVLQNWNPEGLDPERLTKIYEDAGARFLMIQGVHHDNYDLWDSKYHPWNSVNIGPKRDLLKEWEEACRKSNMKFGVTFHHEYTWWWWQTAFGNDKEGEKANIPYDGHLSLEDGKGKWWEGYDPRLLYGVDLREYKGVEKNAHTGWSAAPAGIFSNHLPYANWYSTQWALRIMDVVENYKPDFIYTDGTVQGPFVGYGTGTGYKSDAMPRVMADFYNRTLQDRGEVNTFSIVKFRSKNNGTVNTEEHGIPEKIKTDQPWIAETPVGDWFYAPNFTYDSGMMIKYIIEAIARDGNAAICISLMPDGSINQESEKMLKEVGVWMKRNGQAVYGSRAWEIHGEGEIVDGKLKQLPGGALRSKHADFEFNETDFRFTVGEDNSLYVFSMVIPGASSEIIIKSLNESGEIYEKKIQKVSLLGFDKDLTWVQDEKGLIIKFPENIDFRTSAVFKID
ncbi:alpha-L-fucosidase [Belliella sp. DSM 107340]|uniref:alpha-L-fucosidase n=1 Tax=Belliella calami TaxID=2923436 RepID=A0ABS9UKC5_9BACT|nr:alpha-L-fucosidase [Belliella calami]MCH7396625.1 alpha-L-fucosidase [Belliella calami]